MFFANVLLVSVVHCCLNDTIKSFYGKGSAIHIGLTVMILLLAIGAFGVGGGIVYTALIVLASSFISTTINFLAEALSWGITSIFKKKATATN